jgi:hypothetical protein
MVGARLASFIEVGTLVIVAMGKHLSSPCCPGCTILALLFNAGKRNEFECMHVL